MSSRHFLLVEDNADDEELTLMAMEENNIANEVVVARDGAEALDHVFSCVGDDPAKQRPLPAVVLLDLRLPKISGLEVLRRIRSDPRTETVPIIILTSSKEDEDVVAGYKLGANAYVRKPVGFGEFSEAVKTLGLFWMVLNETPPPSPPGHQGRMPRVGASTAES